MSFSILSRFVYVWDLLTFLIRQFVVKLVAYEAVGSLSEIYLCLEGIANKL